MPKGVPKAGFRMTTRRKLEQKRSKAQPSTYSPNAVVHKSPFPVTETVSVENMDVISFLATVEEACTKLREAGLMTTHEKEGELLTNFAICLERQIVPKYKKKEGATRL